MLCSAMNSQNNVSAHDTCDSTECFDKAFKRIALLLSSNCFLVVHPFRVPFCILEPTLKFALHGIQDAMSGPKLLDFNQVYDFGQSC